MKTLTVTKNLFTASLALLFCQVLNAQTAQPPAPDKVGLTFSTESTCTGEARLKGGDTSFKDVQVNNSSWSLGQNIGLDNSSTLAVNVAYNRTSINEGNYHHFERDYGADRVPLPNLSERLSSTRPRLTASGRSLPPSAPAVMWQNMTFCRKVAGPKAMRWVSTPMALT
jgi:hypothetical protein